MIGSVPHKVWIDKTNWWNSAKTWVVASDGLWSFEPTRWQKTSPRKVPWNNIQQVNFQRERLTLKTTQGTIFIGQRYSNHFYRNLVEQFLEQICAREPTMAIWTNQRIVDIVTIALRGNCLEIYPHKNQTSPMMSHPLDELWIPEIPDRTSAFVQLRVADSEPTPRWLIVHCGTAERAGIWLNTLNVPSRRIKWSNVSIPVREGLFDSRPAKCCSKEHEEQSGLLVWQQNQLSFRCDKVLPTSVPLTFFFDDGRQQFRITTTAIEHQDIPVAQWNLETPSTLDVYNLRAYHRLPTHWDVHLSPVEWRRTGWSVNMEFTQSGNMVDMSVAGCAIQSTRELSESNIWLVQLTLWDETHQFLCIKQNSHPLQGSQWRSGFQFALPHMKTLQMLWRTLQREHNQETEKTP